MRRTVWLAMALGALFAPGTSARGQEAVGAFFYFERADPGSAEDRSSITTLADEGYVSGAGGLTFRCAREGLEMVVTATYLGRRSTTPVRYSFGDEEPRATDWTLRSSGMAAIAPPDVREEFLERAVSEASVVFRVRDFQLRTHAYTFDLDGLAEGLQRLACR